MTFGYEYIGDTAKVRTNDNYGGFPYAEAASASMTTQAAYAGLQTTVLQRLALTGQVRNDWVDGNSPTTWRLGGVYDLRKSPATSSSPTAPHSGHRRCSIGTG